MLSPCAELRRENPMSNVRRGPVMGSGGGSKGGAPTYRLISDVVSNAARCGLPGTCTKTFRRSDRQMNRDLDRHYPGLRLAIGGFL